MTTCELVKTCGYDMNSCFAAVACGSHNTMVPSPYCNDEVRTGCVWSTHGIPLEPCPPPTLPFPVATVEDCVAVEACPPPPKCEWVLTVCENSFTPVDDRGCKLGCPRCPSLLGAPVSPPGRARARRMGQESPPPATGGNAKVIVLVGLLLGGVGVLCVFGCMCFVLKKRQPAKAEEENLIVQ